MTYRELNRIGALREEIKRDYERIEELRSLAESTTQTLSDMPRGSGVSDKVARYAAQIVDLQISILGHRLDAIEEEKKITDYVSTITDPLIRLIIKLRHVDLLKWQDIAQQIGGGNSAESIRQAYHRFLNA